MGQGWESPLGMSLDLMKQPPPKLAGLWPGFGPQATNQHLIILGSVHTPPIHRSQTAKYLLAGAWVATCRLLFEEVSLANETVRWIDIGHQCDSVGET